MSGIHVRLATRDDNHALCALMRDVHMDGPVRLAQERGADFFAFERAYDPGFAETFVACAGEGGPVVGCGTLVIRDAWWPDGARRPVGYISDLRVRPEFRGARVMPLLGRVSLERARDAHATEVFVSAIMASNERVKRAALHRTPARREQPVTRPMTSYHMVSVQTARRPRGPAGVRVERARPEDVSEIGAFLGARQRERTFGYLFDAKLLETRLREWPWLRIDDFRLIRNASGGIAACGAPWDAHALKQTRAVAYGRGMRAYRGGYNAVARMRGWPTLPDAGGELRYATLSHVEADEPRHLRALVLDALDDAHARRLHFLNVMVVDDSPLQRSFRGLVASRASLTLHTTMLADSQWRDRDFRTTRPGFEMALA